MRRLLTTAFLLALPYFVFSQTATPSLSQAISSLSLPQAIVWSRSLKIDASGKSLKQLKAALSSHYGLQNTMPSSNASGRRSKSTIEISSADNAELIKVKKDSQSVFTLTGSVVVSINDNGRKSTITTDRLVINTKTQHISSTGDITYTTTQNGQTEIFKGDSLTFQTPLLKGLIFDGAASKTQVIDNQKVAFRFNSKQIVWGKDDVFIFKDGQVTSSQNIESPFYSLTASRIWAFSSGSIGILGGALKIGHIPVFPLPYYEYSADTLFVNPVLGYSTRYGLYLQTTTYFVGQKKQDPANRSLFASSGTGTQKKSARSGFISEQTNSLTKPSDFSNYVKVMADLYTTMGGFFGVSLGWKNLGPLTSISFTGGVGLSRYTTNPTGQIFVPAHYPSNESVWESPYIMSAHLPFRFGEDLELSLGNFTFSFPTYSDAAFKYDFLSSRAEDFDWLQFAFSFLNSADSTDIDRYTISSYQWMVSGSYQFDTTKTAPWISRASFDSISSFLTWDRSTNPSAPAPDSSVYYYFYAKELTIPSFTFTLSGTLVDSQRSYALITGDAAASDTQGADAGVLSPWGSNYVKKEQSPSDRKTFVVSTSKPFPDTDQATAPIFRATLGYDLTTGLSSTYFFNDYYISTPTPAQTSLLPETRLFQLTNPDLKLTTQFSLLGSIVTFENVQTLSGSYQHQTNLDPDAPKEQLYDNAVSDAQNSYIDWGTDNTLKVAPFSPLSDFGKSYASYELDSTLLRYESPGVDPITNQATYDASWAQWSSADINANTISVNGEYEHKVGTFFIFDAAVLTVLPFSPVLQSYTITPSTAITLHNFTTDLEWMPSFDLVSSSSMSRIWNPGEVKWSAQWQPLKNRKDLSPYVSGIQASSNLTYSAQNNRMESLDAQFALGSLFKVDYEMAYTQQYQWNIAGAHWDDDGIAFTPSTIKANLHYVIPSIYLWRNRLSLTFSLDSNLSYDFIQNNNFSLDFTPAATLSLYKFFDFGVGITSQNSSMYLYFPSLRQEFGITQSYSFFEDLFQSFNFGDTDARKSSFWNIESVQATATLYFDSWKIMLSYYGNPSVQNNKFQWADTFNITFAWIAIPVIRSNIKHENGQISLEENTNS